ncbi:SRPBCC family protein [Chitinilyticum piscinae]|uniref:Coenzyme Q-binding protein COQ10 START domain-containing protein n=1 Tax=Chitinilyticum piscinae TaxID=2866724 RepID=A0A8J7K7L2_9NEIS|nr:SRPBCC family protein [Chitinilyticum piscinae]MBE9608233.1 hypothetical protein [Chitinilyticum piscinae]
MPRLLFLLVLLYCGANAASLSPVSVDVREESGRLLIEGLYQPPVSAELAHAVLTDYEAMPAFVPGLSSSRILQREGPVLKISQHGRYRFGPFTVSGDSVARIELRGREEILCQSLSGSQGEFSSITVLQPLNGSTQIRFRALWQPGNALVATLGTGTVREHVREQLASLQQEMLRRAALAGK